MTRAAVLLRRYRLVLLALAVSAVVHASVFMGMPRRIAAIEPQAAVYEATLAQPPAPPSVAHAVAVPDAIPRPRVRHAARALAPAPALETAPVIAEATAGEAAVAALAPPQPPSPAPPPPAPAPPEVIALAQPTAPPEPEPFPMDALPANVSISYAITSAFADGRAEYNWEREGNTYRITGEAEAEGFFTLFLEGRIQQESRGTLTGAGLRPERFTEHRPNTAREGLEFDWAGRRVTFARGDSSRTTPLEDNTVDWLSMIFQLAHVPPTGESFALQVFTQRKMYRYRLVVLGVEEIEIPLGRVRALHLRHRDPKDEREVVDVWLGIDQHNLPVKMRFPVARNRLMVEQVATRVSSRP